MTTQEIIQQEAKSVQSLKKVVKHRAKKREVILAPDLYEAVLESIQQAQEGKVLSQEEVRQRHGL